MKKRAELSVDAYVSGVRAGNRTVLSRAITLIESSKPSHRALAQQVLAGILPHTGKAHRVGITGVPGVGKSTTIEALGTNLTGAGHKVAVLAVDPTSSRTGGSILGDKTRMARLACDDNAYIRPSPTSGTLGGVAKMTRETMLLCEAAGFDVIIVETVGVGQSETVVAGMVDFFMALMLPGAGDELQGIKKGLLEVADLIAVNKVDVDEKKALSAARDYRNALHIMTPQSADWSPPVLCISGLSNLYLDDLWGEVTRHHDTMSANGELVKRRAAQQVDWMWSMIEDRLLEAFRTHPDVMADLQRTVLDVEAGEKPPALAAQDLLRRFGTDFLA